MFELSSNSERFVMLRCCECGDTLFSDIDNFEIIKDKYVVLKEGIEITCEKCGISQPLNERYLPLENQHSSNLHIPTCPTCGSSKISRIKTGEKLVGFATVGVFSSNFGKTYKCDNCSYKW